MGLQNLSHLFEFQKKKMTFPVQNSTLLKMHQQESLIIVGWFPVLFVFITILLLLLTSFFFYFQCFSSALTFFYRHAIEKPRLFSNPRLFSKPATFLKTLDFFQNPRLFSKPATFFKTRDTQLETRDPRPLGKLYKE